MVGLKPLLIEFVIHHRLEIELYSSSKLSLTSQIISADTSASLQKKLQIKLLERSELEL